MNKTNCQMKRQKQREGQTDSQGQGDTDGGERRQKR